MTVVAVTGARGFRTGEADRAVAIVRRTLTALEGVTELRTGAQYGVDTAAGEIGLSAFPKAKHVCIVPSAGHNAGVVDAFEAAKAMRDVQIIRMPDEPDDAKAYRARNLAMTDGAEMVLAFPSTGEEVTRSGTWMTVRMARSKDIPLVIVPLDGADPWVEKGKDGSRRIHA